jgi:hypothetical protein
MVRIEGVRICGTQHQIPTYLYSESDVFQLNHVPLADRHTQLIEIEVVRFQEVDVTQGKAE